MNPETKNKTCFTLIEILIVMAIIALLATIFLGIGSAIDTQSKKKVLKGTFALLESALDEYYDFNGKFPVQSDIIYTNDAASAHSEFLYGELSSIPGSRKILEKISDSLIINEYSPSGILLENTPPEIYDPWQINNKELRRAIDYYYVDGDNFPVLRSAGPDRIFDNQDDITNR